MAIRYLQGDIWTTPLEEGPTMIEGFPVMMNAAKKEYRLHNPDKPRIKNFRFIDQVAKDPRFLALKEQYQSQLQASYLD